MLKLFRSIPYSIFLLLMTSPVYGQLNPANLTHYSATDGNNINDIITDRFGFIWLATSNGVIRYDGYEFSRNYNHTVDLASIDQTLSRSIFEDSNGLIWVGRVGGFQIYDPSSETIKSFSLSHIEGIEERHLPVINTFTEHSNGIMYFGVESFHGVPTNSGLLYFDATSDSIKKVRTSTLTETNEITSSTTDIFGNSWFSELRSLIQMDASGHVDYVKPPPFYGEPIQRPVLHSDRHGQLWVSFERSILHKYDPTTQTYQEFRLKTPKGVATDNLFIIDIKTDAQNRLWLATDKGLFQFDESNSTLTGFASPSENRLVESSVTSLEMDSFGNIWVGTFLNGLLKYEEKSYFQSTKGSLSTQSDLTPDWANRLFEASDGTVWISTIGFGLDSGINKVDPSIGTIIRFPFSKLNTVLYGISDMDPFSDTEFILSTSSGLHKLNTKTFNLERIPTPGIPDSLNFINNFHRDRNGTEWVATVHNLYQRPIGQTHFSPRTFSNSVGEVVQIIESDHHGIWLVTNFGLYSAHPETDEMIRHGYDRQKGDVFSSQDINSIYDDERGNVWVGTWQGGLSHYVPETGVIKSYSLSDGLPSMGIQYILPDSDQNALWISTFDGISRFDIPSETFVNFTTDEGVHSQLFSDGSGLKTTGGQYYFGGSGGVTFFRPKDIIQNSTPPKITLTGISVSNTNLIFENGIQRTERLDLSHDQNTLSIRFAAIHFTNPDKNRVRYILENHDLDWHDTGNQRYAYYSGLSPGTYTFRVIAANSNGVWNLDGASIEIVIRPPWWRTWWAYGFYGIFFLGAVFAMDRTLRERILRMERERAREKELEQAKEIEKAYEHLKAAQDQLIQQEKLASLGQLTAGIAHEIKNPLNFMNNFASVSVELVSEAKEEVDRLVSTFNIQPSILIETLGDIDQNLHKIVEHGSRADGIVKSMLMHSRGGTGKKEPTDLNALVKEYANLSYHGMRASKNPIDADVKFDLDESVGTIPLIAEDFSRVILNICNNGFDAMKDVGRGTMDEGRTDSNSSTFDRKPSTLSLRTKRNSTSVTIEIEDNGPGIPAEIKDKILQPFFTTKRGTQGTGLGLSITQDIIKAHGGQLEIESEAGRTVFSIKLEG